MRKSVEYFSAKQVQPGHSLQIKGKFFSASNIDPTPKIKARCPLTYNSSHKTHRLQTTTLEQWQSACHRLCWHPSSWTSWWVWSGTPSQRSRSALPRTLAPKVILLSRCFICFTVATSMIIFLLISIQLMLCLYCYYKFNLNILNFYLWKFTIFMC